MHKALSSRAGGTCGAAFARGVRSAIPARLGPPPRNYARVLRRPTRGRPLPNFSG